MYQQRQQPPQSATSTNYSAYAPQARGASANVASPVPSQASNASAGPMNPADIEAGRVIARQQYHELGQYLSGSKLSAKAGSSKEKLTRLTRQQFSELSKDVYDELIRRKAADASVDAQPEPFLLSQTNFHPKRNQARQKLATLPTSRFKDLASDLHSELERRHPEFKEELPPSLPAPPRQTSPQKRPTSPPYTQANASQLASKQPSLSKTMERATPNEMLVPNKSTLVEEDVAILGRPGSAGASARPNHTRQRSDAPSLASLRMQDRHLAPIQTGLGGMAEDLEDASVTSADRLEDLRSVPSPSTNNGNGRNLQAIRASEGSSVGGQLGNVIQGYSSGASSYAGGIQSMMKGMTSPTSPMPNNNPLLGTGNTALAAKTKELQEAYDSLQNAQDDLAAARADSEARTRNLEKQIDSLEAEIEEEKRGKKRLTDRLKDLEADLKGQAKRNEEQASQLDSFRREYDELSQRHQQELDRVQSDLSRSNDDGQRELRQLRSRVQESERALSDAQAQHARALSQKPVGNSSQLNEARGEAANLLKELQALNIKFEQLAQSHESEVEKSSAAAKEVEMWRTRYQRSKTELRAIKATSQLVLQPAQITEAMAEDFMPISASGGLADFHITLFQSSIDVLLVAGRSESPSSVLKAANAVVVAVGKLDGDVQSFENAGRTQELASIERDRLQALKARCHSTLSNLITASKNHAAARGFSPVSLLDAAASHLSITIVDMIKILKVRKASEREIADFQEEQDPNGTNEVSDDEDAGGWSQKYNYPSASSASNSPQKTFTNGNHITNGRPPVQPTFSHTPAKSIDNGRRRQSPVLSTRTLKLSDPPPREPAFERLSETSRDSRESTGRNGFSHSPQSSYGDHAPYERSLQGSPEKAPVRAQSPELQPIADSSSLLLDEQEYTEDDMSPGPSVSGHYDPAQFRLYLENQTENIVQAIQSLLSAIRGGRQGQDLLADLNTISGLVIGIVDATRDNLPSQSQTQAKEIRADLKANYRKLDDLQNDIAQGKFDKQVKQSVAAASFAIARSLKSLNLMFSNDEEE